MTTALISYCVFLAITWCCIGWSMYCASTDIELWGEELE